MKVFDDKNLPPVGLVCEVNETLGGRGKEKWVRCEILTHYDPCDDGDLVAVYAYKTPGGRSVNQRVGPCFREVKSKEQIEAEKRAAKVDDLVKRFAFPKGYPVPWKALFEQMYDCGVFK